MNEQEQKLAGIFVAAVAAGEAALEAAKPTPMAIVEADILTGEPKVGARRLVIDEGPCGFAWVVFPGNTAFGRHMKKHGHARKAYGGGLQYWVSQGGQSMQRKEAFARAFASVLKANGIDAFADSRMD